jgi:hypothetical protein
MTPATDHRKRAIELLEILSPDYLTAIVQLLEFLTEPTQRSISNPQEMASLEVIKRHLSPDKKQRLDDLRDRCEWGELTPAEHEELLQYEDQMEQWRVERLQALMELAKLKDIDWQILNRQLTAGSQSSHAR